MKRPKNLLFAPLPDALYRLPGGPKWVAAFYFVGWLCAHVFFIQALITGKVPLRRTGGAGFDLQASSPPLFWVYIAIIGTILLLLDALVVRFLWRAFKKEAIQSATDQRP
jgi:hypothetical protein